MGGKVGHQQGVESLPMLLVVEVDMSEAGIQVEDVVAAFLAMGVVVEKASPTSFITQSIIKSEGTKILESWKQVNKTRCIFVQVPVAKSNNVVISHSASCHSTLAESF